MQTCKRIWRYTQEHRKVRLLLGHGCALLVLATIFLGSMFGPNISRAFAQSRCASGDKTYTVVRGDTLSGIGTRYNMSWQTLASYNHMAQANLIFVNQTICIPQKGTIVQQAAQKVASASINPYPYGQCTWWANERYHQLHGIYVPWIHQQSNAWQWTARARQFAWHVSSQPSPGAIVDLQPWVQGAYDLGHVAVVEKILSNGHVIASNMNWGANPGAVTNVEFAPGPGVTFLTA